LNDIRDWLKVNYVEVLDSLVPGVSRDELKAAEEELGFELPDSMRVLYQLCNGQFCANDKSECDPSCQVGLLGGYYFYEHFVNVHVLSLNQVVRLTRAISELFRVDPRLKRVVFAASSNSVKVFFLDCNDGQVYVGTRDLQDRGEMMPCTPTEGVDLKDAMLRWLERYRDYLQKGHFAVRVEKGVLTKPVSGDARKTVKSICLFPLKGSFHSVAVTKGMEVENSTSSSVWAV
jgi:F-box protein 3